MLSNASTFRRIGVGFALIAAPLMLLVGDLISPAWSDETADYVADVAANTSAQSASGVIYTLGFALMVVGAIGVANCIRGRGVTLANIAVALAVVGLGMFPALTVTSIIDTVAIDSVGQEGLVALIDASEDSTAFVVLLVLILVPSLISLLLLGIAVGRSGLAPWWVAGALILATPLLIAGSSQALAVAASALQLIGFGYLGIRIIGLPNERWERPPLDWRSAEASG